MRAHSLPRKLLHSLGRAREREDWLLVAPLRPPRRTDSSVSVQDGSSGTCSVAEHTEQQAVNSALSGVVALQPRLTSATGPMGAGSVRQLSACGLRSKLAMRCSAPAGLVTCGCGVHCEKGAGH